MNKILSFLFLCFAPLVCRGAEYGVASFYSVKTNGGTTTASGERLRDDFYTAAHKTLPFGTLIKVTNLKNNKTVVVKCNDRGPFIKGRIVDVSLAAAKVIDLQTSGIAKVKVEVVKKINK
jgi:rare lipoprotein A